MGSDAKGQSSTATGLILVALSCREGNHRLVMGAVSHPVATITRERGTIHRSKSLFMNIRWVSLSGSILGDVKSVDSDEPMFRFEEATCCTR